MSQIDPSKPVSPARIIMSTPPVIAVPQKDAAGNIISATSTGTDGVKVGVEFPPFPDQNSITFTKVGASDLEISSTLAGNSCTLSATVGGKELTFTFTSGGPLSLPEYVFSNGGAYPDTATMVVGLQNAFEHFFVENFDDHFEFDFGQMLNVCKQAALQRSPTGVNPTLTSVLLPAAVPAGAEDKSKAGIVGRAIIWGVAGAAIAIATGGGALLVFTSFVWGADASALSDIVTAIDNSSDTDGGGGGGGKAATPGGTNNQGDIKTDLPVDPPKT